MALSPRMQQFAARLFTEVGSEVVAFRMEEGTYLFRQLPHDSVWHITSHNLPSPSSTYFCRVRTQIRAMSQQGL